MYIPTGMRERIKMVAVVVALLKSSWLVILGTMFWYMREDSTSKGTADPTAITNPFGFVPRARKVPMGSNTFAMLSIRRVAKLENTTMIFSRRGLVLATTNREMIASKVPVPTTGSRPNPGKLSTNRGPGATVPYARTQL